MKIESKLVEVPAERTKVFAYISDLNNFQNLLPEGKISNWESNTDYCSFKVQGTATIDLHVKDLNMHDSIVLKSGERSPFPFTLNIFLSDKNGGTQVYQIMEAAVNPFLKMMVEKPLANLFDFIAEKLVTSINK